MTRWLEIAVDYRCNQRCVGCFSVQEHGPEMTPREIVEALALGRREGAASLWLGGGEPTLRRELFGIVREARKQGYARIKLQTNGMMLGYAAYAQRCADAGITEVSFSIKGSTAELHDRLTRTPGAQALLVAGIAHAKAAGLALEADLLAYRSNVHDLPPMVATYEALGIGAFRVWVLSCAESSDPAVRDEVPRIADVVARVGEVLEAHPGAVPDFVRSLHTPPCTLPEAHRHAALDVATLEMRVVNPGGFSFPLESSPIEGGTYLPGCAACRLRANCRGVRADYLAIHGDAEFRPVPR